MTKLHHKTLDEWTLQQLINHARSHKVTYSKDGKQLKKAQLFKKLCDLEKARSRMKRKSPKRKSPKRKSPKRKCDEKKRPAAFKCKTRGKLKQPYRSGKTGRCHWCYAEKK